MKIMIAAVFYFLYWGVCFLGTGTDRKNLIGLRSYPDEVQTRVQSDPQLGQAVPKANRHMRQILRIYNGASREMSLPLKN